MKDLSKASRIITPDNLELRYWVTWNKELTKDFIVLHPASSMNHSSLEALERMLNERGNPTVIFDPRWRNYPESPIKKECYTLEKCSGDLQQIVEKEGLENPLFIGHSAGFMPIADYVARTSNACGLVGICASHKFSETTNKIEFVLFDRFLRYGDYLGCLATGIAYKLKGEQRGYPDQSNLYDKSDFPGVWLKVTGVSFNGIRANVASGKQTDAKWDISEQLGKIDKPTVLIYGKNDIMVRPIAGEYMSKMLKGDCHAYAINGTHSLPLKSPEKIIKIIEEASSLPHPF